MTKNVLCYLEASAAAFPQKTAAADGAASLTFSDLQERCARIGSALARAGVCPRDAVAVFAEKNTDALCAMLGAVYAGGFYSVFSTELPQPRLEQITQVLCPKVIVTTCELLQTAQQYFPHAVLCTVEALAQQAPDRARLAAIRGQMIDTDPLYVNFTSGSTGTPKGIVVSHRSVIDFIGCFTEIFGFSPQDVIANQAPFDFDVSVKDIYSAMKTGATLLIVPRPLFSAPAQLVDFLCAQGATAMIWAVSALSLLSTFHALDYKTPQSVNKILFSGEVMPYKVLRDLQAHLPNALYANLYGPTEITCNCTYHILQKERDYSAGIPIGIAFPNEDVFLLDADNRALRGAGETGEICVRGSALALGYYAAPEQTARHFVQNPLNTAYAETVYRTGDLGAYNENGELIFRGRKDFQIKYMGHRIELEEIERAMAGIAGVASCCCTFDEKKERLYGFYVGSIDKQTLHTVMKQSLPAFMVPGFLRRVEAMPLTKNGKIDRKMLSESAVKKTS